MKVEKGSALWRGIIAAIVGAVAMLLLMLAVGQFSIAYLLAGPFYGFGFAFANWHVVMQKTKRGAVQGGSVFAIGLILSHWLKDWRFGIFGWIFFLIRISWHLGFCWIPGIWYGIQAIREESKQQAVSNPVSDTDAEEQQLIQQRIARAAAAQAAAKAAQTTTGTTTTPFTPTTQNVSATPPVLSCVAGTFAGATFPIQPGEMIYLGSDPSACQIVLPGSSALSRHCALRYNPSRNCWQVQDLSGGQTFLNGIQPVSFGVPQDLPKGAILCVGQGKNSQRFCVQ